MLFAEPPSPPAYVEIAGPAQVVDGDTLRIGRVSIRLYGVDAPEADQTCTQRERQVACGVRSAAYLRERTAGVSVRCAPQEIDRYQRPVALCTTAHGDLGAAMVAAGWAVAYRAYSSRYTQQQGAAKAAGRGLWAMDFQAPSDYRRQQRGDAPGPPDRACAIKGNINAKGERIFHLPGTRAYPEVRINSARGERWFCSAQQALAAGWRAPR